MHTITLAGRTVLIVEDQPLVAADLYHEFAFAGADVFVAASLARATELVEADEISAAVIDFRLPDGDANSLCSRLNERGIPYVLHSGYAHVADACHRKSIVPKPDKPSAVVDALVRLLKELT